MKNNLKVEALRALLKREHQRLESRAAQDRFDELRAIDQKREDAILERGIPELLNPKANITLINHKYAPDRKLFPEKSRALHEARGWRPITLQHKLLILMNGMLLHFSVMFIVAMIALYDF